MPSAEKFFSIGKAGLGAWGAVKLVELGVESGTQNVQILADAFYDFDPANAALAGISLAILVAGDMAWRPNNERFAGWVIRNGLSIVAAGAVTMAPAVLDVMRSGAPVTFEASVLPVAVLALIVAGGKMLLGSIMRSNATSEYSVHSRGQNRPRQRDENLNADGTRKLDSQRTSRGKVHPLKEPAEYVPTAIEIRGFLNFAEDVQKGRAGSDEKILDDANYYKERFDKAELSLQPRDVGESDRNIEPKDLPIYYDTKGKLKALSGEALDISLDAAERLWPYPERPE